MKRCSLCTMAIADGYAQKVLGRTVHSGCADYVKKIRAETMREVADRVWELDNVFNNPEKVAEQIRAWAQEKIEVKDDD